MEAIGETVLDLHGAGLVDQVTMRNFDKATLLEEPEYTADQIKTIRTANNVSQSVFADFFNMSVSAIQKWETGAKHPSGSSLRLLQIVERKGLDILAHH